MTARCNRTCSNCRTHQPCTLRALIACAILLQVFELNELRAWSAVLISICSMAACIYAISIAPWYLLPLAWAVAGTAFTGVSSRACDWASDWDLQRTQHKLA